MEDQNFSGKVVVITGGAAGIGRATALRFAQSGARIAGWDVSVKAAAAFKTDKSEAGGQTLFQLVNVADPVTVEAAVNAVVEQWGGIDVLINNAGIVRDAQLVQKNGTGLMKGMLEEWWKRGIGTPEDIANAYFWLASDHANFVHGTVLSVDGGVLIGT